MIHRHSPSNTIANAPEVPSSTQMPYFDPRNTATTYFPTSNNNNNQNNNNTTPVVAGQQVYNLDMNSVAAVNTTVATVNDMNNSLPPLSQLLPNKSTKVDSTDYFSPQTKNNQTTVPSQQSQIQTQQQQQQQLKHYGTSMNYQRNMYPPPDRRYIPAGGGSNNNDDNSFYMIHQQNTTYTQPPPIVSSSNTDMSSMYTIPPHPYRTHLNQHDYHLPSPPTSVIDGVLVANNHDYNNQHVVNGGITNNSQKVFSFVPLPGLNQKKRPRRKFHEVERLYQCNYQDCNKSYGTLNHLNAHVSMQRHGNKRQPTEFKELRKMWRKQKRDNKQRSGSRSTTHSLEEQDTVVLSNNNPILSHHHDYMPPYMQHHPSLLSHPPPPPPTTLWRSQYQQHQPTEFMPPPPGY